MAEESGFWDISASDLIGGYLQKEQADNQAKIEMLKQQAAIQQAALNSPEYMSAKEAIDSGYTPVNNERGTQSYFDRMPKPLLYGSLALLGGALLLRVVK